MPRFGLAAHGGSSAENLCRARTNGGSLERPFQRTLPIIAFARLMLGGIIQHARRRCQAENFHAREVSVRGKGDSGGRMKKVDLQKNETTVQKYKFTRFNSANRATINLILAGNRARWSSPLGCYCAYSGSPAKKASGSCSRIDPASACRSTTVIGSVSTAPFQFLPGRPTSRSLRAVRM